MPEPLIAILTGWDGSLGRGHIQRMASLLNHLVTGTGMRAMLVADACPDFLPEQLRRHVRPEPDGRVSLFVRDRRDSSVEEISRLQKSAPVLCVDDLGPGRETADYAIDLLPNPYTAAPTEQSGRGLFLYGYDFCSALEKLGDAVIEKNLDFTVYAGSSPADEYVDFLVSLIPPDSRFAVFRGTGSFMRDGSTTKAVGRDDYARLLLSSRVLISHFGIALYEARAASCRLVAINPSQYHSRLCDIAPADLGIQNLGTRDTLDAAAAATAIRDSALAADGVKVSAAGPYAAARENLDRFSGLLRTMV
ncbi:MAG: hypothetical protein MUC76_10535 [Spirochaetes bacterium]|jgi:hypothetical protein|nr:hypothetical protein [Spirochaetota bacterium]